MADRKRKLATSDSASTSKRNRADEEPDEEIEAYKEKHMKLRLQEQRRIVAEQRAQLEELQQHKLELESTCRLIDARWSELAEFLNSQLGLLPSTRSSESASEHVSSPPVAFGERVDAEEVRMKDASTSENSSSSNSSKGKEDRDAAALASGPESASSFLARVLRIHSVQEGVQSEMKRRLADRTRWARQSIERLCAALQRADAAAVASLQARGESEASSQLSQHQAETRRLQAKLLKLRAQMSARGNELAELETMYEELRQESSERFVQLSNCQRRLDKLEHELAEARAAAAASASALSLQTASGAAPGAASDGAVTVGSDGATASGSQYANMAPKKRAAMMAQAAEEQEKAQENLRRLETELDDAQKLAASRLAELESLVNGRAEMAQQLAELRAQLAVLPEAVLLKTHGYMQLKQHNQILLGELARAHKAVEEAVAESARANARAAQERSAWEALHSARVAELQSSTRDLKKRLRQACTEVETLSYENERSAADRPSTKLVDEFRSHADLQQRQLTKLREENRKLRENLNETQVTTDSGETLSGGQLFRRLRDKEKDLTQKELAQKTREQEWADRERDLCLIISTYKSSQRDSRDLLEVRQSEKRLEERIAQMTTEVEDLKTKLAETSSVSEATSGDGLAKRLQEATSRLETQKEALAMHQEEREELMSEITSISGEWEESQQQNARLLQKLKDKEGSNAHLMKERIRTKKLQSLLQVEKEETEKQLALLREKMDAQADLLKKSETHARVLQEQVNHHSEELRVQHVTLENYKRLLHQESQAAKEAKLELKTSIDSMEQLKMIMAGNSAEAEKAMHRARRMEEERDQARRKLERMIAVSGKPDELLEEELKAVKVGSRPLGVRCCLYESTPLL